ncbi:MAG: alpha/beta hydrolase [Proteobacteria bacterium]|nr:alpha/beta hydrolase [Pseudomonadota bacterium]
MAPWIRIVGAACALALCAAGAAQAQSQAQPQPRSAMVDVGGGVQLHVLETGTASNAPTIVLIPGWRLTASVWSHQLETFGRTHRVIAFDPRSQGDSTKTGEGDTPEQRARDYHAALETLHAGPIVLIGWSQGVQDVAAYVDQFGTDRIKAVVLVDSTISKGAADLPNVLPFAVRQFRLLPILAEAPREFTDGLMRAIISRPVTDAERAQLVDQGMKTPSAISQAMLIADLFGRDRSTALPKFKAPTLVIASGRSAELEAQKAMTAALPDGRIEVMPNAAHAVFVDDPETFERLVGEFLAKVGG